VYVGRPISFWAPVGELVILVFVLFMLAVRNPTVTGRQENMPPIADSMVPRY
jgi:hypothetical protein